MKKIIIMTMLSLSIISNAKAATWVNLHENNTSKLLLDKESILDKDDLKKAWVKIEYKIPQKNNELVEKEFNTSKLLWYFDCKAQKAATSQIFQYSNNDEIVYSAAIDSKNAQFLEPIPDTDMDISMRYVCGSKKSVAVKKPESTPDKSGSNQQVSDNSATANSNKTKPDETPKADATSQKQATEKNTKEKTDKDSKPASPKTETAPAISAKPESPVKPTTSKPLAGKTAHWTYEGNEGPANWAKLSPEFVMCELGRNQSPINIDSTIHAILKPLKTIQKFPAKDIFNNGHTVQVNFKEGNMMVLDSAPYQMKQVHFHAPSENTIHGESFPLEAHFVHADSNGNLTVIGVMFKEGKANEGLTKLWAQLPTEEGAPTALKSRILPNEMIPQNPTYFRFSGSLTTPPCSEGVRWVLMKTPMTASKDQIDAFKKAVHHQNNRPVQALNGRAVLE
jgi:carbonic anhydrase